MRTLSGLPGETHPSAMVTLSTRASQCSPNSRGSLSRNSALPPTAPDANLCNRQRHHKPRVLYLRKHPMLHRSMARVLRRSSRAFPACHPIASIASRSFASLLCALGSHSHQQISYSGMPRSGLHNPLPATIDTQTSRVRCAILAEPRHLYSLAHPLCIHNVMY